MFSWRHGTARREARPFDTLARTISIVRGLLIAAQIRDFLYVCLDFTKLGQQRPLAPNRAIRNPGHGCR